MKVVGQEQVDFLNDEDVVGVHTALDFDLHNNHLILDCSNHSFHCSNCSFHHIRNPVNYTMMSRETRKIKCLNLFSP